MRTRGTRSEDAEDLEQDDDRDRDADQPEQDAAHGRTSMVDTGTNADLSRGLPRVRRGLGSALEVGHA